MKKIISRTLVKILGVPRYVKWRSKFFYCIHQLWVPNAGYSRAYYQDTEESKTNCFRRFSESVNHVFSPQSVVDIGCGGGAASRAFLDLGVKEVFAFDNSADAIAMAHEKNIHTARQLDLTKADHIPAQGDLCVCMEVAEHLPARHAPRLCALLSEAAPIVLMSAAQPGQGGHLHVNEQPRSYWIELMKKNNMMHDPVAEGKVREGYGSMYMGDYSDNLMVFQRTEKEISEEPNV